MATNSAEFSLFLSTIYLAPKARDLGVVYKLAKAGQQAAALDQKGTVLTAATSDKVAQLLKTHLANLVEIDSFAYKDQKLAIGGVPVFEKLHDIGGITLLGNSCM
jgi:hypothetical protein